MSVNPITETSAVDFTSTSQLLVKPGSAKRTICGPVMRSATCAFVKP